MQQIKGLDISKRAQNLVERRVPFSSAETNGRIRAYRRRNGRFSSSCMHEVDSHDGGSVMMWAANSNDSKTELVHVPGNLTAVRYRDEILQPHLMHVIDRQREYSNRTTLDHTQRV